MQESVQDILKRYEKQIRDNPNPLFNDLISYNGNVDTQISAINQAIIQRAEGQKLKLRDKLTKTVIVFIWIQVVFFNFVVLLIVLSVTSNIPYFKPINNGVATLLFGFLKYYISATIVELLGMLGFILHYVFSKYSGIEFIKLRNKK